MVSPDLPPLQEPLLVLHRRAPALTLPEDPSPEELAQYWTLSSRDKEEIGQCRGEGQRRRFAVQLCTLRTYVVSANLLYGFGHVNLQNAATN
jgi:hypothetical protein